MPPKKELRPVPAWFWSTPSGNEPVREWLQSLPKADRHAIGDDLRRLQFGMACWYAPMQVFGERVVRSAILTP